MRYSIFLSLLLSFNFTLVEAVRAEELSWLRNFEQAAGEAKAGEKDLFILFTGHGWCYACEVLDREVFQQPEFTQFAADDFVFVEFDFNFGDSEEEKRRKAAFMSLRSRYLAPAVPTVVLADTQGLPYAYITGYDNGTGLQEFLAKIASARKAKEKRDKLTSLAASRSGDSKAKMLSEALTSIIPQLGKIGERGDDPLLRFYGEVIDDILKLTDGKGDTAQKFVSMQKQRDEWIASEAVFEGLKEFKASKDYAGAINYIDSILPSQESPELRWRLEWARQIYLEWDDKNQEALDNSRRLMALKEVSDENRELLLDREAYNLFGLNRVDEGLSHYDRRIENAGTDLKKRLRLLFWKSQMVLGRDPVEQSIAAWRSYRKATESGTDEWSNATSLLARELRRADRHLEAVQLVNGLLKKRQEAWLLLDAAESHIALENTEEALQVIAKAESQVEVLRESSRKADRDMVKYLEGRIVAMKDQLAVVSRKDIEGHTSEPKSR